MTAAHGLIANMPHNYGDYKENRGRWKRWEVWREVITVAVGAAIICIIIALCGLGNTQNRTSPFVRRGIPIIYNQDGKNDINRSQEAIQPCFKTSPGRYRCGEEYKGKDKRPLKYAQQETIRAKVTAYVWTGYVNAAGYFPIANCSIACPRRIKLGTKVIIKSVHYTCDDRTAKAYDGRYDIYYGRDKKGAIQHGIKTETITINYK